MLVSQQVWNELRGEYPYPEEEIDLLSLVDYAVNNRVHARITCVLALACDALQARCDALETDNADLKARVTALEALANP